MTFKIESRLPVALFKQNPFIYASPDFTSFPLGTISTIIDYHGIRIQRFLPLTVSKVIRDNFLIDQMFCFSIFYINDDDLILYLTHPIWFDKSNIQESLVFFHRKIEELARFHNCKSIKLEFHEDFTTTIAFPTSLSDFSYDLNEMQMKIQDLRFFKQYKFHEETSILCYEQSIQEFEKKIIEEPCVCNDYKIHSINQSKFIRMKKEINNFQTKAYALTNKDLLINHRFIPYYGDTVHVAHKRSKWFNRSSLDGYIEWSPNFFELFKLCRSHIPFLFWPNLKNYTFKYGKIYNWALKEENNLFTCLLSHALHSMKQKGIEKCQIAYINDEEKFMKTLLEQYGFKKVHKIKILKKIV